MKLKLLIGFILISSFLFAQSFKQDHSKLAVECKTCHDCDQPTRSNPCLVPCPRDEMITINMAPEDSPDLITIDKFKGISDLYDKVVFTHRLHAEMSGMAGGCQMCHHYNPPGNVVSCTDCHERERKRADISKPDLKGAYHRQCVECHREWSTDNSCESCHTSKSGKDTKVVKVPETKTAERVHPKIIEPTKLVYKTNEYDEGTLVTFYHNEHTMLFGLECSSCHKNESCAKCHSQFEKVEKTELSFEEQHERCASCHDTDDCESCHKTKELAPFDHGKNTGFVLKSYHSSLSCNKCHKTKNSFKGLSQNCVNCHGEFDPESFDHKVTGLALNDMHSEFECESCHVTGDYKDKPTCDTCHDEEISYPAKLPGKRIK